ncbi:hypothetical protein cyc_05619 [Cyclospora cayetanensis]|uniref:Uncharacterized protein n=1 Tax=Cyclospora cayetanensis TaxID=88456 RepID=A0A1D3D1J2_9EIME|nr:hypothetical protein cyc_05619 [Cyclospora cayetanensis]
MAGGLSSRKHLQRQQPQIEHYSCGLQQPCEASQPQDSPQSSVPSSPSCAPLQQQPPLLPCMPLFRQPRQQLEAAASAVSPERLAGYRSPLYGLHQPNQGADSLQRELLLQQQLEELRLVASDPLSVASPLTPSAAEFASSEKEHSQHPHHQETRQEKAPRISSKTSDPCGRTRAASSQNIWGAPQRHRSTSGGPCSRRKAETAAACASPAPAADDAKQGELRLLLAAMELRSEFARHLPKEQDALVLYISVPTGRASSSTRSGAAAASAAASAADEGCHPKQQQQQVQEGPAHRELICCGVKRQCGVLLQIQQVLCCPQSVALQQQHEPLLFLLLEHPRSAVNRSRRRRHLLAEIPETPAAAIAPADEHRDELIQSVPPTPHAPEKDLHLRGLLSPAALVSSLAPATATRAASVKPAEDCACMALVLQNVQLLQSLESGEYLHFACRVSTTTRIVSGVIKISPAMYGSSGSNEAAVLGTALEPFWCMAQGAVAAGTRCLAICHITVPEAITLQSLRQPQQGLLVLSDAENVLLSLHSREPLLRARLRLLGGPPEAVELLVASLQHRHAQRLERLPKALPEEKQPAQLLEKQLQESLPMHQAEQEDDSKDTLRFRLAWIGLSLSESQSLVHALVEMQRKFELEIRKLPSDPGVWEGKSAAATDVLTPLGCASTRCPSAHNQEEGAAAAAAAAAAAPAWSDVSSPPSALQLPASRRKATECLAALQPELRQQQQRDLGEEEAHVSVQLVREFIDRRRAEAEAVVGELLLQQHEFSQPAASAVENATGADTAGAVARRLQQLLFSLRTHALSASSHSSGSRCSRFRMTAKDVSHVLLRAGVCLAADSLQMQQLLLLLDEAGEGFVDLQLLLLLLSRRSAREESALLAAATALSSCCCVLAAEPIGSGRLHTELMQAAAVGVAATAPLAAAAEQGGSSKKEISLPRDGSEAAHADRTLVLEQLVAAATAAEASEETVLTGDAATVVEPLKTRGTGYPALVRCSLLLSHAEEALEGTVAVPSISAAAAALEAEHGTCAYSPSLSETIAAARAKQAADMLREAADALLLMHWKLQSQRLRDPHAACSAGSAERQQEQLKQLPPACQSLLRSLYIRLLLGCIGCSDVASVLQQFLNVEPQSPSRGGARRKAPELPLQLQLQGVESATSPAAAAAAVPHANRVSPGVLSSIQGDAYSWVAAVQQQQKQMPSLFHVELEPWLVRRQVLQAEDWQCVQVAALSLPPFVLFAALLAASKAWRSSSEETFTHPDPMHALELTTKETAAGIEAVLGLPNYLCVLVTALLDIRGEGFIRYTDFRRLPPYLHAATREAAARAARAAGPKGGVLERILHAEGLVSGMMTPLAGAETLRVLKSLGMRPSTARSLQLLLHAAAMSQYSGCSAREPCLDCTSSRLVGGTRLGALIEAAGLSYLSKTAVGAQQRQHYCLAPEESLQTPAESLIRRIKYHIIPLAASAAASATSPTDVSRWAFVEEAALLLLQEAELLQLQRDSRALVVLRRLEAQEGERVLQSRQQDLNMTDSCGSTLEMASLLNADPPLQQQPRKRLHATALRCHPALQRLREKMLCSSWTRSAAVRAALISPAVADDLFDRLAFPEEQRLARMQQEEEEKEGKGSATEVELLASLLEAAGKRLANTPQYQQQREAIEATTATEGQIFVPRVLLEDVAGAVAEGLLIAADETSRSDEGVLPVGEALAVLERGGFSLTTPELLLLLKSLQPQQHHERRVWDKERGLLYVRPLQAALKQYLVKSAPAMQNISSTAGGATAAAAPSPPSPLCDTELIQQLLLRMRATAALHALDAVQLFAAVCSGADSTGAPRPSAEDWRAALVATLPRRGGRRCCCGCSVCSGSSTEDCPCIMAAAETLVRSICDPENALRFAYCCTYKAQERSRSGPAAAIRMTCSFLGSEEQLHAYIPEGVSAAGRGTVAADAAEALLLARSAFPSEATVHNNSGCGDLLSGKDASGVLQTLLRPEDPLLFLLVKQEQHQAEGRWIGSLPLLDLLSVLEKEGPKAIFWGCCCRHVLLLRKEQLAAAARASQALREGSSIMEVDVRLWYRARIVGPETLKPPMLHAAAIALCSSSTLQPFEQHSLQPTPAPHQQQGVETLQYLENREEEQSNGEQHPKQPLKRDSESVEEPLVASVATASPKGVPLPQENVSVTAALPSQPHAERDTVHHEQLQSEQSATSEDLPISASSCMRIRIADLVLTFGATGIVFTLQRSKQRQQHYGLREGQPHLGPSHLSFCLIEETREASCLLEERALASAILGVPGGAGKPVAEAALSLLLHQGPPDDLMLPGRPLESDSEAPASERTSPTTVAAAYPSRSGVSLGFVRGRLLLSVELIAEGGPSEATPSWASAVSDLPPGIFLCRWKRRCNSEAELPGRGSEEWVTWEALCASLRDQGPPGCMQFVQKAVRGPPDALVLAKPFLTLAALQQLSRKLHPFLGALLEGLRRQNQPREEEAFGFGLLSWSAFQSLLLRSMASGAPQSAAWDGTQASPVSSRSCGSAACSSSSSLTAEEWLLLHGCMAFRQVWRAQGKTVELFDLWNAARSFLCCHFLEAATAETEAATLRPSSQKAADVGTMKLALRELLAILRRGPRSARDASDKAARGTSEPAVALVAARDDLSAEASPPAAAIQAPREALSTPGLLRVSLRVGGARNLRRWAGLLPSTFATAAITFVPAVAACLSRLSESLSEGASAGKGCRLPLPPATQEPLLYAEQGASAAVFRDKNPQWRWSLRLQGPPHAYMDAVVRAVSRALSEGAELPPDQRNAAAMIQEAARNLALARRPLNERPAAATAAATAALLPLLAVRVTVWLLDARPEGPLGALPLNPDALTFPAMLDDCTAFLYGLEGSSESSLQEKPSLRHRPCGWLPMGRFFLPLRRTTPDELAPPKLMSYVLEPVGAVRTSSTPAALVGQAEEGPCGLCTASASVE